MLGNSYQYNFTGQYSDWSKTQTITLHESTPTPAPTHAQSKPTGTITAAPTQNPIATPIQPDTQTGVLFGFDWQTAVIVGLVVVVAVLAVGMVAMWRKMAAK